MTKLEPYEYLRLQKTCATVQTVSDALIGQQCIFFYKEDWIFDYSLEASVKNWEVTQQVYFRNARKHQSLAFALPYIVVQLRLSDTVKYLRVLVTYGTEITKMVGSMDHFIKQEKGIKAWIEQPDFSWQASSLAELSNRILQVDHSFSSIEFYRYHEPFHPKLDGKWEKLSLGD
jgi:hypothetical protein